MNKSRLVQAGWFDKQDAIDIAKRWFKEDRVTCFVTSQEKGTPYERWDITESFPDDLEPGDIYYIVNGGGVFKEVVPEPSFEEDSNQLKLFF